MNVIAIRNTAVKLAICTVAALALNIFIYAVPMEYKLGILIIGALAFSIKCFYDAEVIRLKTLDKLNK